MNYNFPESIKFVLFYFLLGLLFLGILLIIIGIEGNSLFIKIGVLLLIPYLLLLIYLKIKKIKISKESEVKIDFLKNKGDRITVDLDDCEIIAYKLNEEFSEVNKLDLSESYTILNFEILYKNHTINYSYYSEKDVETIKIHFVIKKTAILYVNPKNYKQNYIDLEFLNK